MTLKWVKIHGNTKVFQIAIEGYMYNWRDGYIFDQWPITREEAIVMADQFNKKFAPTAYVETVEAESCVYLKLKISNQRTMNPREFKKLKGQVINDLKCILAKI